ncbi:unnamed protein product [Linum trigynum]|uniref:Uncharacterized protein n=1 Tax=Linum trigynum TaxID=586398 RepID=A0AAV2E312_9ROSI
MNPSEEPPAANLNPSGRPPDESQATLAKGVVAEAATPTARMDETAMMIDSQPQLLPQGVSTPLPLAVQAISYAKIVTGQTLENNKPKSS